MRIRYTILILTCILAIGTKAQVVFKTLVTKEPVVVGQPFRVQYVMEEVTPDDEFETPVFTSFHVNQGPDVSAATDQSTGGLRKLRNISFIITPEKKGRFSIPRGKAVINGKTYYSNEASINVIGQEEAARQQSPPGNSNTYLAPGEDPSAKIKQGLFVKVIVDRTSCFVGQPITATFKLYSRLNSRSDIVKNPGFYGFTIQDVVTLKDKKTETEMVEGRMYDVHTVRVVQLYPLNEGEYEVDPMEIRSQVNFSTKPGLTLPEQDINEGVYEDDAPLPGDGWVRYEHVMSSDPVSIRVRPLPASGKPSNWNGAVGRFTVASKVVDAPESGSGQSFFELTISGKGNFPQLVAPMIHWPDGIEGFEPKVEDKWDMNKKPLQGYRRFVYPFVESKAGTFVLPAVSFSYYDTDSNKYNTVTTKAIEHSVDGPREANASVRQDENRKGPQKSFDPAPWFISGIVILVILGVIIMWRRESKREKMKPPPAPAPVPEVQKTDIGEFLRPAYSYLSSGERDFFAALNQGLWQYFSDRLNISGTQLNKNIVRAMLSGKVPTALLDEVMDVLHISEMAAYTIADAGYDKEGFLESAHRILGELDTYTV